MYLTINLLHNNILANFPKFRLQKVLRDLAYFSQYAVVPHHLFRSKFWKIISKAYCAKGLMKNIFLSLLPEVGAEAHCDIPCGIYDPTAAKIAAMTVLRMVLQINELHPPVNFPKILDEHAMKAFANSIMRRIAVKEQHAESCKKELLILWTDFFKPEHLEKAPYLHEMMWKATKLCSVNKQDVSEEHARELITAVDAIAKLFYEVKGVPERYAAYQTITDKVF